MEFTAHPSRPYLERVEKYKRCDKCHKILDYKYAYERETRDVDLYVNMMNVDLCPRCKSDLVEWLHLDSKEFGIVKKES